MASVTRVLGHIWIPLASGRAEHRGAIKASFHGTGLSTGPPPLSAREVGRGGGGGGGGRAQRDMRSGRGRMRRGRVENSYEGRGRRQRRVAEGRKVRKRSRRGTRGWRGGGGWGKDSEEAESCRANQGEVPAPFMRIYAEGEGDAKMYWNDRLFSKFNTLFMLRRQNKLCTV